MVFEYPIKTFSKNNQEEKWNMFKIMNRSTRYQAKFMKFLHKHKFKILNNIV